jgi:hypothetical protein
MLGMGGRARVLIVEDGVRSWYADGGGREVSIGSMVNLARLFCKGTG